MIKIENSTRINGVKIITPEIYGDERGENLETYNKAEYACMTDADGTPLEFVLDSVSKSRKNVLRGLHGDMRTWKLIQCLWGEIYFVVTDIREQESSCGKWESFTLDDTTRQQILVPPGVLNGHVCMSDHCIFSYKKTAYYIGAEAEIFVKWDNPDFNIPWPVKNPILSRRDNGA